MPFEYRALDLLADYETRFEAFPKIWNDWISGTENEELLTGFTSFLRASVADALIMLSPELDILEFGNKLSHPNDRDRTAAKQLTDLGLNSVTSMMVLSYFAGRRNLLDDERCWVRFCGLIEEIIHEQAC